MKLKGNNNCAQNSPKYRVGLKPQALGLMTPLIKMLICWHSLFWLATISFVFCLCTSISVTSHTRVSAELMTPHYSVDHSTCKTCLAVLSSFLDFFGFTFSWLCSFFFFLDSLFVSLWLSVPLRYQSWLTSLTIHISCICWCWIIFIVNIYSPPSFVSGLSRLTLTISYWLILGCFFFLFFFCDTSTILFTLETFITCHNTPH